MVDTLVVATFAASTVVFACICLGCCVVGGVVAQGARSGATSCTRHVKAGKQSRGVRALAVYGRAKAMLMKGS
jgi:hypothetical protein